MSTQFQATMNYPHQEYADQAAVMQPQQQPPPPQQQTQFQQQQQHFTSPQHQHNLLHHQPPQMLHNTDYPTPVASFSYRAQQQAHQFEAHLPQQQEQQAHPQQQQLQQQQQQQQQGMFQGMSDLEFEDAYMDEQLAIGVDTGTLQGSGFSPETSSYDEQQQQLAAMQVEVRQSASAFYTPFANQAPSARSFVAATAQDPATDVHQAQHQQQQTHQPNRQAHQDQKTQISPTMRSSSTAHQRGAEQESLSLQTNECVLDQLERLIKRNTTNEDLLRSAHNIQEVFVCQLQHGNRIISMMNHNDREHKKQPERSDLLANYQRTVAEFEDYKKKLAEHSELLRTTRDELTANQVYILNKLTLIQKHVIDEIRQWNLDQQHSTNHHSNSSNSFTGTHLLSGSSQMGSPVPSPSITPGALPSPAGSQLNYAGLQHQPSQHHSHSHSHSNNHNMPNQAHLHKLNCIENHIKLILDIATYLRKQVIGLYRLIVQLPRVQYDLVPLASLKIRIDKFFEKMILESFVVEKQPPQVMKTNTRFTSHVRLLGGSKLSSVSFSPPHVKVTILSETNAREVNTRRRELVEQFWRQQEDQLFPQKPQQPVGSMSSNHPQDRQQQQQMDFSMGPMQQPNHQHMSQQPQPPQTAPRVKNQSKQSQQQHPQRLTKIVDLSQYDSSGEILNNANMLEYQEATSRVSCQFRNMQLKRIKRTEKKGHESVMDEKFILMFHAEIRLLSNELDSEGNIVQADQHYHIMAFSLPVVVIVHGNQEPDAWATITWHNAFAVPSENLYQLDLVQDWARLGQVLSDKFRCCAGKGLSRHDLEYLQKKVCSLDNPKMDGNSTSQSQKLKPGQVSWAQFSKVSLPDRSFTFWVWFHSILKLTREHLRDLWCADKIYGFLDREGATRLLLGDSVKGSVPVATFLLRYSETELGGIALAWLADSIGAAQGGCHSPPGCTNSGNPKVYDINAPSINSSPSRPGIKVKHLLPFSSKDLTTRGLADRLRDLDELLYLYPNIPKDDAFEQYYSPVDDSPMLPNGYIRPMLITTLPTSNYSTQKPDEPVDWQPTVYYPN